MFAHEDAVMTRWLLWLLSGLLLGGIVHIATVLYLPSTATQNGTSSHM